MESEYLSEDTDEYYNDIACEYITDEFGDLYISKEEIATSDTCAGNDDKLSNKSADSDDKLSNKSADSDDKLSNKGADNSGYSAGDNVQEGDDDSSTSEDVIGLSREQQNAIKILSRRSNLIVNAVAGSGKSTVLLEFARLHPKRTMIMFTYNSFLQKEVNKKILNRGLTNIKIFTYHGFANRYYAHCYEDYDMLCIIYNRLALNTEFRQDDILNPITGAGVDYIFVDEAQDIRKEYMLLVVKLIVDARYRPNIAILGDKYQNIYSYSGSDYRYLLLSNVLLRDYVRPNTSFATQSFKYTFRIKSGAIIWFINDIMIGREHKRIKQGITYEQSNSKVEIIKTSQFVDGDYRKVNYKAVNRILDIVFDLIQSRRYRNDDIFLLFPFVRSNMFARAISAGLVNSRNRRKAPYIDLYIATSDESAISDEIINNKIVISTYHQAKGRERAVVFLFNFDNSYFKIKREEPALNCTNDMYVAATRSRELLYIVQFSDSPISFSKIDTACPTDIEKYVNYTVDLAGYQVKATKPAPARVSDSRVFVSSNRLLEKLSSEDLYKNINLINQMYTIESPSANRIEIHNTMRINNKHYEGGYTKESAADITSTAINMMFEYAYSRTQPIYVFDTLREYFGTNFSALLSGEYPSGISNCICDYFNITSEMRTAILLFVRAPDAFQEKSARDSNLSKLIDSAFNIFINIAVIYCDNYEYIHKSLADYPLNRRGQPNKLNMPRVANIISSKKKCAGSSVIYGRVLQNITRRLTTRANSSLDFEKRIGASTHGVRLVGAIDVIDADTVWEIKCVSEITVTHKFQLLLYAYIIHFNAAATNNEFWSELAAKSFRLYNARTDEVYLLTYNHKLTCDILDNIFSATSVVLSDDDFVREFAESVKKYILPIAASEVATPTI